MNKQSKALEVLKQAAQLTVERAEALLADTEWASEFEQTAAAVVAVVRAEILSALEPAVRKLIDIVENERNPHAVIRAIELLVELGGIRQRAGLQVNVTQSNLNIPPEDVQRLRETVIQLEQYARSRQGGSS